MAKKRTRLTGKEAQHGFCRRQHDIDASASILALEPRAVVVLIRHVTDGRRAWAPPGPPAAGRPRAHPGARALACGAARLRRQPGALLAAAMPQLFTCRLGTAVGDVVRRRSPRRTVRSDWVPGVRMEAPFAFAASSRRTPTCAAHSTCRTSRPSESRGCASSAFCRSVPPPTGPCRSPSRRTAGPRIYPVGAMISHDLRARRLPPHRASVPYRFGGAAVAALGVLLAAASSPTGVHEVLTATRENLRAAASPIQVMAGGGAASAYDSARRPAVHAGRDARPPSTASEDWGTYVAVHALIPRAERRALEAVVKCIDHGATARRGSRSGCLPTRAHGSACRCSTRHRPRRPPHCARFGGQARRWAGRRRHGTS